MHFSGGTYHEPRAAGHFMAGLPQTSLGQVRLPSQSSQVSNSSICTPPATRGLASPEISPQVVSSQSLARIPSEDGWGNGGPYTQEQLGTPPPLTPSTVRYSLTATEMPTPVTTSRDTRQRSTPSSTSNRSSRNTRRRSIPRSTSNRYSRSTRRRYRPRSTANMYSQA